MDAKTYISKLLDLPKSATFLIVTMFCLQSINLEAASAFQCPPTTIQCPPTTIQCPPTTESILQSLLGL